MRILFVSAEVAPYAKVGGLGDVAAALPKALANLGHDVRIVTPDHGGRQRRVRSAKRLSVRFPAFGRDEAAAIVVGREPVPIYFVASNHFFGGDRVYGEPNDMYRYHFFNLLVAKLPEFIDWVPDIIHCNDWHTALLPYGLRNLAWHNPDFRRSASVLTIHNLAYRGPDDLTDVLSQGIYYADVVSTVSPTYAEEITTPEQGMGLDPLLRARGDKVWGIVNGLDLQTFNPAGDPAIAVPYDLATLEQKAANKAALQNRLGLEPDLSRPLAGVVSRVDYQKGIDLLAGVVGPAVEELGMQFAILGSGDTALQDQLRAVAEDHPHHVRFVEGYDAQLAQQIYAGADLFLMPSRFEPCGLGQLIAMRYGTIPVVRHTGGLADTVADFTQDPAHGTGFQFEEYEVSAFYDALTRAEYTYRTTEAWRAMQRRAMEADHSWDASALEYVAMYEQALAAKV